MKYSEGFGGCKVKILTGKHAGKIGILSEPSQEIYGMALTLQEEERPQSTSPVYHYKLEDLEVLEHREFYQETPEQRALTERLEAEWEADKIAGRLDD